MTQLHNDLCFPDWVDLDRWNRNQSAVFEEICARFDEGNELVVLDNPCGGGKSLLGYMTREYLNVPGYYLVGTKGLQDQIESTLGLPTIKGRANYTPNGVTPTSHWSDPTCADCDKDADTGQCSFCIDSGDCPYTVTKFIASMHEFPVANYSYAFGEWSNPMSPFSGRGLVVCDEADTIADELLSHVSVEISPRMQQRLNLDRPALKTVESAWVEWFSYAVPHIQEKYAQMPRGSLENKRRRKTIANLIGRLRSIRDNPEGWVYEYANDFISFKPVTVDHLAPSVLWKHGERFLCMSGSGGSPEQFVEDLGFEGQWAPVFAPSTFPVTNRPIYVCPSARMTRKTEQLEWPKMAKALLAVIDMHPDDKILVHTHSYALTKFLYNTYVESLEEDQPSRVECYLAAEKKDSAVKWFEATDNAVLLAPSLDRGYDHSDIDICVICKVPSPYLGSKQVQKRLRETRGGQIWYANETVKTLTQMYGRVMRSEHDSGTTIVLDEMFSSFYSRWKRLFSPHVIEAIDFHSDIRFELRQRMKSLTLNLSAS